MMPIGIVLNEDFYHCRADSFPSSKTIIDEDLFVLERDTLEMKIASIRSIISGKKRMRKNFGRFFLIRISLTERREKKKKSSS